MYRLIMVPLDGSRFAESALPVALSVSRRTGVPVHLVTVQEPIASFAYDEWENAAQEWSRAYLDNVLDRAKPLAGAHVTATLLSGHVVDALEKEAESLSVDLVVMATHGRGAFSRAWLGSVADAFLHHTRRPVLLLRPDEGEQEPDLSADPGFGRMLVALDGTELSESVLEHAVSFGILFKTAFHLVRIVPYPMQFSSPYLPHTMQMNQQFVTEARDAAAGYLEEHADRLRQRGLTAETAVAVVAQPGHGILTEVLDARCDLVAMATHGRAGLTRAILGSTSDKVVRGSHVPVLLYRPAE
ncbi:MAG: universal stress protein [Longimicrobiales bacterium]|nr:universal stress protein [Longimicrobiales bacterium]